MLTSSLIFHRFLQVGKYITWAPLDTSWRRVEKRNPLRLPSCLSRLSKMLAGSDFVSSNNSSCVIEDAEVMIVECMKTSTVRNSDSKNYTVDQNSTVLVDFADVPEDRIANNPKRRRSCHLAQSRCSYATISRKLNFRSRSSDEVVMSKSTEIDEVMIVDEGHQVLLQQQFYTNPLPTIPRPPEDTSDSITKNFRVRGVIRKWEPAGTNYHKPKPNCQKKSLDFTLASYNVLCQTTIGTTMYLYPHCPKRFLDWNYRWPNLAHEMWMLNADILCLQEVEAEHYENYYKPYLSSLGYQSVYKKRTGGKPDGCATFFKTSKFRLLESRPVEYLVRGTLLNRDNVGLILILQPADSEISKSASKNDRLVVANTHLLFNPKRGDIKLAQLALFIAEIEKAAYRPGISDQQHHPVVVCGDFNTLPHSPLYHLMIRGELKYEGCPQHGISNPYVYSGSLLSKYLLPREACVTDDCIFLDETNNRDPPLIRAPHQSVINIGTSIEMLTNKKLTGSSNQSGSGQASGGTVEIRNAQTPLNMATSSTDSPAIHTGLMRNPFKMVSVYDHFKNIDGTDEVTTQHAKESATVDYIFYSVKNRRTTGTEERGKNRFRVRAVEEGNLLLLERYSLVSASDLYRACGNLPNQFCSSDHLPIVARFRWCQN